ncbi:MAG: LysE family translocator [Rubellimicrobium sp.]|nr:LysE family translocator [Rubellimicrobium sp.]
MPTAAQLLLLVSTLSLAILSPGPGMIAATQTAFARGRAAAMPYGIGLAAGASLWALFAILGLAIVFQIVPALYLALKLAGGLYLLWIARAMWLGASGPLPEAAGGRFGRGFFGGVMLNLSNPKPALFYSALFVAVFPGPLTHLGRGTIYAAALGTELTWYVIVTAIMSTAIMRARYIAARGWIDRGAAAIIAALGIMLLVEVITETVRGIQ